MAAKKYEEGTKARTKFERTVTALFRVPKSVITEKIKNKPKKKARIRPPYDGLGPA